MSDAALPHPTPVQAPHTVKNGWLKRALASDLFYSFRRSKLTVVAAAITLIFFLLAVFAPVLSPQNPFDPAQLQLLNSRISPLWTADGQSPFLLGTDEQGRDVLSAILYGLRISLIVGILGVVFSGALGIALGLIAGYFGGRIDDALMRFTEFFQTIPSFALAIVLVAILQPSIYSIVAAIGLVSWPPVARLVRGEVLSLRTREYVQAAIVTGQSNAWIIWREILPNALSPVIVLASLMVATAILLESSLSFLGLGDPNLISWGYMVGAGRTVIRQAWWITVFPGVAILLSVLGLNLIGEGLNDALNPRLSREGR